MLFLKTYHYDEHDFNKLLNACERPSSIYTCYIGNHTKEHSIHSDKIPYSILYWELDENAPNEKDKLLDFIRSYDLFFDKAEVESSTKFYIISDTIDAFSEIFNNIDDAKFLDDANVYVEEDVEKAFFEQSKNLDPGREVVMLTKVQYEKLSNGVDEIIKAEPVQMHIRF